MGQHDILEDPNRIQAAARGIWNISAAHAIAQLLDTLDPTKTIVHVHSWTKGLSSSVVRAAIDMDFIVVCTMHDYFLACPNGGFFNYPEKSICKLDPLSGACIIKNCDSRSYSQKLWRVARQVVQQHIGFLPKGVKNFISVSDFSESILKHYLPVGAEIYRVNNPIEIEKDDPVAPHKNNAFVFIGRLSMEKGCHLLAKAGAILEVETIFVGDGICRDDLLRINPSAFITGWLDRDNMKAYLAKARTLVLPSLWYETQGLVVLEAAAMGIPAIVPDTSAARDWVDDGVTGLWFKGGDSDDLAKKMMLLKNNKFAEKAGKAAYEKYWSHAATMQTHVSELLSCYYRVLSTR